MSSLFSGPRLPPRINRDKEDRPNSFANATATVVLLSQSVTYVKRPFHTAGAKDHYSKIFWP